MAESTTLAYLAGVIDSDGYITVHRSVRSGKAYYAARIGIAGTRRQPHDLAASLWGGTVSLYQPKNPRHRGQYQWSRSGDGAYGPISDVLPYLRVKKEQAHLAIEAQDHILHGRGDDPYPWMPPDYDPGPFLAEIRHEVVRVLNQDRRADTRT
ncbi:hypothetical protein ACXZ65_34450 [Streptomyces aculeolatus]